MQKAMPYMEKEVKNMIHNLLEDEDIAKHLSMYTDAFYQRYSKMFWGSIGGRQKGLNYAVNAELEKVNPLANIFDDEGNISLSAIAKGFLRGDFKQLTGGGSTSPSQSQGLRGQGIIPDMQRI